MKTERLLQSQGFGSRKECRSLIRSGALCIGGQVIDDPFAEVDTSGLTFEVRGEIWQYREKAYLMLHKPANYECSHKPHVHPSVYALLPLPLLRRDVQCVGRLDQDTTGLMLLSDDGQFIHVWSSGKKRIPKTYEITTSEPVTELMLATLLTGVQLHDDSEPIRAVACEQTGACALRLTITEGKYHQVKRMVAAVGNHVVALHRASVGGLGLDNELPAGAWRWLEDDDLAQLGNFKLEAE
jgi:16S rRNA pseudouridine516 synthase